MLVKNWMSKDVITADVDDSMQDALKLLKDNNIRMRSIERSKLQKLKAKLREKAALHYMIDHRENKREFYSDEIN